MKELVLVCALALPASGSAWFGSERGAIGPDPHVRVYKMLMDHMSLNLIEPKRALLIGNHPRMVYEMRKAGMEAFGLASNAFTRGYVMGYDSAIPIKEDSMALVIYSKMEPVDPWMAMRVFQGVIRLIVRWGFLIVDESGRFNDWLPKYGFSLLPFSFNGGQRIWQKQGHDYSGQPTNGYHKHLRLSE